MGSILVIDDEPGIRATVKDVLEDEGYPVAVAEDGPAGLAILSRDSVDVVVLDVWLPRMGGIDVLKAIKADHPAVEVIVISGHATIDMAVSAVKLGAFDFIEKPLSIERLATAVRNARNLADLRLENARLKLTKTEGDEIIGSSQAMAGVMELIGQSAQSDARVLITGSNGTGKELAARRIHDLSARARGPFVAVNCAAMPDTLIESELFGHERGSFTGADRRKEGLVEVADGGTVFLDEIGEVTPAIQAKLLRILETGTFRRLGGTKDLRADVRFVAATNRDLQDMVRSGSFRADLYYRLSRFVIEVPPLRERGADIVAIAERFVAQRAFRRNVPKRLGEAAAAALMAYHWPGNIRELKNVVERAVLLSGDVEVIGAAELGLTPAVAPVVAEKEVGKSFRLEFDEPPTLEEIEEVYLARLAARQNLSRAEMAAILGISERNTYRLLAKYGLR